MVWIIQVIRDAIRTLHSELEDCSITIQEIDQKIAASDNTLEELKQVTKCLLTSKFGTNKEAKESVRKHLDDTENKNREEKQTNERLKKQKQDNLSKEEFISTQMSQLTTLRFSLNNLSEMPEDKIENIFDTYNQLQTTIPNVSIQSLCDAVIHALTHSDLSKETLERFNQIIPILYNISKNYESENDISKPFREKALTLEKYLELRNEIKINNKLIDAADKFILDGSMDLLAYLDNVNMDPESLFFLLNTLAINKKSISPEIQSVVDRGLKLLQVRPQISQVSEPLRSALFDYIFDGNIEKLKDKLSQLKALDTESFRVLFGFLAGKETSEVDGCITAYMTDKEQILHVDETNQNVRSLIIALCSFHEVVHKSKNDPQMLALAFKHHLSQNACNVSKNLIFPA